MRLIPALVAACLLPFIAVAGDLKPRAEVNVRAGTERSILMTEFWAPLAQQSDRVLYGDLRLMGDDGDNREGNLGFGYRQISKRTNSVLGGNVWIDRRRTENGNSFHQLTLGVESLGDKVDLRANGYIQLNSSKTTITPNIGSAAPYLAGSGIFFDTNGFIVEEPQDGFDAEIGYRLPVLQKHVDATRVYAGGYHFWGDQTENVTGFRLRGEAQVNSIFSVGARFQHDGPRGSQGFLEATLRFPFKSKKLFQEHGLKSRLDESPERDIDIVTNSKVIDTGLMKPVLNSNGTAQRVLYVDNTNAQNGDGSKENPFNTLANAQTALHDNDILYINRGDGTTTGMDQGITVSQSGVKIIGSGSDLSYGGYTLLQATVAPTLTNTQIRTDEYSANIILINDGGGDILISGLTLNGAAGNGIYVLTQNGRVTDSVVISNVNASNNLYGIDVKTRTNGVTNNIRVSDVVTNNNTSNGLSISAFTSGKIGTVFVSNVTANNNGASGFFGTFSTTTSIESLSLNNISAANSGSHSVAVRSTGGAIVNAVSMTNIKSENGLNRGISFEADTAGSEINNINISDVTSIGNATSGILLYAYNSAKISNAIITNAISINNQQNGVYLSSNSNALITNTSISNVITNNNSNYGIYAYANGGSINTTTITNSTANSNAFTGIILRSNTNSIVNGTSITNLTANNNAQYGFHLLASANSSVVTNISLSSSTISNNTLGGVYLYKQNASATLLADFGGGSLASPGQNRIFGNVGNDIILNYVGGGLVLARNNWWGSNTAPTRVTVNTGTTLDTLGYLAISP